MMRLLPALLFMLVITQPVSAAGPLCGSGGSLQPLGYGQVTISTTAVALPSIPTGAFYAIIVVETNGIRWRDDGTNPTSSVGMAQGVTALPQTFTLCGTKSVAAARLIRISSDSVVSVAYYGP